MRFDYLVAFLLFLLLGCKTSIYTGKGHKELAKGFKLEVFGKCISESYHVAGRDLSFSSDFKYGLKLYRLIDSLATNIQGDIITDSIRTFNQRCVNCNTYTDSNFIQMLHDEGKLGKRTIQYCMEYYLSNELDSIAIASTRPLSKLFNKK